MMRARFIMKEKGITTQQLAEKLGVSVSAVNQQLSGSPSLRNIETLAKLLKVPMWQMFASKEEIMEDENLCPADGDHRSATSFRCPVCSAELKVVKVDE